ncbi:hypothetical protein [Neobacillus sp. PS3-40]|uniref:hypothetical protein n=1 Tax=Neobacillus sp. PS3-40 TaxID=3070679 RepID=UPI0027DFC458|nr:hypothetical protein [Neobacillus sp. PS3-40]WML44271.1 hypothetical protein RCG20_21290 [Neobacillus sp. PS3-40]
MKIKLSSVILTIISLLLIWGVGLYSLIKNNDEVMVVLMPLFTYLLFRKPKNKREKI